MRLTFIGLSCFLFENQAGFRLVIDPFEDAPEWSLGPKFPELLDSKPFGSNLVLFSESDPDHSRRTFEWQQNAPEVIPGQNPFPGINLRGVVLQEYSGEPCIGWSFTIDNIRFLHLSDMPYPLTANQIEEIGQIDIVFISPPKTHPENMQARNFIHSIIEAMKPKMIIWSHHIAPRGIDTSNRGSLRSFFIKYLAENASSNLNYEDESSFIELSNILENALILNDEFQGTVINSHTIELTEDIIQQKQKQPILFAEMYSDSNKPR